MTQHAPATLPGEDGAGTPVVRDRQPTPISAGSHLRAERAGLPTGLTRSIGTGPGNATSALLKMPFIVDDLSDDEGPIFVSIPLQFFPVIYRRGKAFISKTAHSLCAAAKREAPAS